MAHNDVATTLSRGLETAKRPNFPSFRAVPAVVLTLLFLSQGCKESIPERSEFLDQQLDASGSSPADGGGDDAADIGSPDDAGVDVAAPDDAGGDAGCSNASECPTPGPCLDAVCDNGTCSSKPKPPNTKCTATTGCGGAPVCIEGQCRDPSHPYAMGLLSHGTETGIAVGRGPKGGILLLTERDESPKPVALRLQLRSPDGSGGTNTWSKLIKPKQGDTLEGAGLVVGEGAALVYGRRATGAASSTPIFAMFAAVGGGQVHDATDVTKAAVDPAAHGAAFGAAALAGGAFVVVGAEGKTAQALDRGFWQVVRSDNKDVSRGRAADSVFYTAASSPDSGFGLGGQRPSNGKPLLITIDAAGNPHRNKALAVNGKQGYVTHLARSGGAYLGMVTAWEAGKEATHRSTYVTWINDDAEVVWKAEVGKETGDDLLWVDPLGYAPIWSGAHIIGGAVVLRRTTPGANPIHQSTVQVRFDGQGTTVSTAPISNEKDVFPAFAHVDAIGSLVTGAWGVDGAAAAALIRTDAMGFADCKLAGKCLQADKNCDDGEHCTVDGCDASKGCVHKAIADKNPCGDDSACLAAGTCTAGKCTGATSALFGVAIDVLPTGDENFNAIARHNTGWVAVGRYTDKGKQTPGKALLVNLDKSGAKKSVLSNVKPPNSTDDGLIDVTSDGPGAVAVGFATVSGTKRPLFVNMTANLAGAQPTVLTGVEGTASGIIKLSNTYFGSVCSKDNKTGTLISGTRPTTSKPIVAGKNTSLSICAIRIDDYDDKSMFVAGRKQAGSSWQGVIQHIGSDLKAGPTHIMPVSGYIPLVSFARISDDRLAIIANQFGAPYKGELVKFDGKAFSKVADIKLNDAGSTVLIRGIARTRDGFRVFGHLDTAPVSNLGRAWQLDGDANELWKQKFGVKELKSSGGMWSDGDLVAYVGNSTTGGSGAFVAVSNRWGHFDCAVAGKCGDGHGCNDGNPCTFDLCADGKQCGGAVGLSGTPCLGGVCAKGVCTP